VSYFSTTVKGLAAAAILALGATAAHAGPVTVQDNYYGGLNTYNGADVIGPTSVFDIKDAVFQRIGPGGNTLQVTIDTNYAGVPGTPAADGTGYGALFITPGLNAWNPTGPAPYANDVYTPGEWTYAFDIPENPGAATSGTGSLYTVSSGSVVMSNVFGNTITYPFPGNPGYYFRQGQAVQFTPGQNALSLAGGGWQVNPGQLVLTIDDNHLLGDNFAFSWAMTCGNDVIQGQVGGVPEPATWTILIMGFGALGAALRRRRAALAYA
jgi:hypothetical protein